MSYRSIKRVLGETSLERKCRFLFGACLLLLISASFWLYGSQTENMVYERNRDKGQMLVDQVMYLSTLGESGGRRRRIIGNWCRSWTKNLPKQQYEWRFIKSNAATSADAPKDNFEKSVLEDYSKPMTQRPYGGDPRYVPRAVSRRQ